MLDILFFAVIAAFIGFRLYNALGHKNFEPGKVATSPKVENKPEKIVDASYTIVTTEDDSILNEKFGEKLAGNIREIRKSDPSFVTGSFLNGVRKAFEIIVKAFSSGDKNALKPLLSKDVYINFAGEIDKRETQNQQEETTLVAILSSDIKNIALNRKYVKIAVQIVSEQINVIRDRQGKIIDGNPSQVDKVEEIWTFGRNLESANPNWELLETAAI